MVRGTTSQVAKKQDRCGWLEGFPYPVRVLNRAVDYSGRDQELQESIQFNYEEEVETRRCQTYRGSSRGTTIMQPLK